MLVMMLCVVVVRNYFCVYVRTLFVVRNYFCVYVRTLDIWHGTHLTRDSFSMEALKNLIRSMIFYFSE